MADELWSKEFPKAEGVYWARRTQTDRSEPQAIRVWDYEGDWYAYRFGDGRDIEADDFIKSMYEYLGPVTPADAELFASLRESQHKRRWMSWRRRRKAITLRSTSQLTSRQSLLNAKKRGVSGSASCLLNFNPHSLHRVRSRTDERYRTQSNG